MDRNIPLPGSALQHLLQETGRSIDQLSMRATWPGSIRNEYIKYPQNFWLNIPLQTMIVGASPDPALAVTPLSIQLDPGRWVIVAGCEINYSFGDNVFGSSGIIVTAGSEPPALQGNSSFGGPLEYIEPGTFQLALPVVQDDIFTVTVQAYAGASVTTSGGFATAVGLVMSAWVLAFPG